MKHLLSRRTTKGFKSRVSRNVLDAKVSLLEKTVGKLWLRKGEKEFKVKGHRMNFQINTIQEAQELIKLRFIEQSVLASILDAVEDSDVFYDIGAGLGYTTCFVSSRCKHVHSFEPQPENAKVLRSNISRNSIDNVTVHEVAFSNRNKLSTMSDTKNISTDAYIKDNSDDVSVNVRRGDSYLRENDIDEPDVVYMDIGGAEYRALKGLQNMITSDDAPRKLFVEIHRVERELLDMPSIRAFGGDKNTLVGLLGNYNYTVETLYRTPYEEVVVATK